MEDRRRHILEEYTKLQKLEAQEAKILVVGAGFMRVEWVTVLEHFFQVKPTFIDLLPRCLGPLPDNAADYCCEYMAASCIKEFFDKCDPKRQEIWKKIELPGGTVKRIPLDTAIHEQNGYAKLLDDKYTFMTNVDNCGHDVQAQAQHARGLSTPARC